MPPKTRKPKSQARKTKRPYRRESFFPVGVSLNMSQTMYDSLESEADAQGVALSTVTRAAIDAGLPVVAMVNAARKPPAERGAR